MARRWSLSQQEARGVSIDNYLLSFFKRPLSEIHLMITLNRVDDRFGKVKINVKI